MKEKLHILHFPKWYPHKEDPQLGVFIQKQIKAASQFDLQSVLYIKSTNNVDGPYEIEQSREGNVFELRIYYKKPDSRARQFMLLNELYDIGTEIIESQISKVTIFHVHNLITPAVWVNKFSKKHAIPWVLSEHWSGYTAQSGVFSLKMKWERKLWQWYSEKAKCTIAVSQFLLQALKSHHIGKDYKIVPNVIESIHKDVDRNDSEIRILNVSDMVDDIKNISGLLNAFAELSKSNDMLRLWIVGGGEDLEKMKLLANELNVKEKVKFFGRLKNNEVLQLYNEIDFVQINSRVETFSVVAGESLMAGKPVITTKCGGVEEFIDEKVGLLIEVDNQMELLSAMKRMIESYKDYQPEELVKIAKRNYSSEAIGKQLSEIYHSIIQ